MAERAEALEAADRLKTAFISHVSYELRTPLTNIIGFSELLESPAIGPLTERQREYLGDIRLSGRTLLAIIDDILDLATIDAGTLELTLAPVNVGDLIKQAVQGLAERIKQNDLVLDIDIEPGVDEFVADGKRVTQMLYNLLSNAIGFSGAGGGIALRCGRQGVDDRFHRGRSGRRHRPRTISTPCSIASRAAPTARGIAAPGSGFRSSRASQSFTAARSRSTPLRGVARA